MKRYVDASIAKRLGAFILDLCLIILGATVFFLLCMEIFSGTTLMKEASETINNIQIESNLYKYSDVDSSITVVVDEKEYSVAIKNYYIEYKKDETTYHQKMNESKLFNYTDGEYKIKYGVSDEDVKSFYQTLMGEAILEIKDNEDYKKCSDIIINCELYCIAISILLSYIIFIIVIPLIFKNKTTIGQKVMKLALVNSENYQIPSNTQIIFRAIIIFIIEYYLATYCLGLTALISIGFIVFRKDHSSYHDLLSATRMIDYHYVELDDISKEKV